MNEGRYKIGTLAKMTGFGIPTIRNWERRYGLLQPVRVPPTSCHGCLSRFDPAGTTRAVAMLLGLGLFIAKAIASAHGGDLKVESSEDDTMFRLVLPRLTPTSLLACA